MNNSFADLQLKRGQLVERMAHQRADLSRDLAPVTSALATADRARLAVRSGMTYLRQHPLVMVAALTGLAILRPGRVVRLAGHGLAVWRNWRNVQAWVPPPVLQHLMNRLARRYFQ